MKDTFTGIKYLIVGVFVLILSACSDDKSTAYFLTHPEDIQPTYDHCIALDDQTAQQSNECVAVMKVIPIFRSYVSELMNNSRLYGLNIMRAEIKLTDLQKAYQLALQSTKDKKKIENLRNEIELQELEIQSRLALIRLLFKMR